MNQVEAFLSDVVFAIASSVGAAFAELEPRVQGNFKARIAADAIRALMAKVPPDAENRETVMAIYATFVATLSGKPDTAPVVPLPRGSGPSATPRKRRQRATGKA